MRTQTFPSPVLPTLPLVTALHQAESGIARVTSREQLGNGVEARPLGRRKGEEGGMKGKKSERGGLQLLGARLGSAPHWLCDPGQVTLPL